MKNEIIVFAKAFGKNFIHRYWSEESTTNNTANINNATSTNNGSVGKSMGTNQKAPNNKNTTIANNTASTTAYSVNKFEEIEIDLKIIIMKEVIINKKSCLVVGL